MRASQEHWRRVRGYLNQHRRDLTETVQHLYPAAWRVAGTPLLARPGWIPAGPVPLDRITLSWRPEGRDRGIDGTGPETGGVRPRREDGRRFGGYADALGALSRPALLENRVNYRLLEVRASPAGADLAFGAGRYFDFINVGEALAHEYAAATLARDGWRGAGRDGSPGGGAARDPVGRDPAARGGAAGPPVAADLPLRSLIGDPADLRRRPALAAVATLVLRAGRAAGEARMILHWRDPARVATGGGLYQVAPVGMFQPSGDAAWNLANDFSLWRAITRELSEELLGTSEDYGSDAAPIDYARWPLHAALTGARRGGLLRVYWLGLGIDPLTLATDLLTVAVFDAALFDATLGGLATSNAEGQIVAGDDAAGPAAGIPFTAGSIERFTTAEAMQPGGAALLRTAWAHRAALLAG